MLPKFRVWNEKLNKVFEVTNYDWTTEVFSIKTSELFGGVASMEIDPEDLKEPLDFIYMQLTTLKDKNGVDIFEGDIVKIYSEFGDEVATVKFNGLEFYLKYINPAILDESLLDFNLDLEVIGNIYENKELLE